jgi:transcriptional regulator with XRE-family HTH domain
LSRALPFGRFPDGKSLGSCFVAGGVLSWRIDASGLFSLPLSSSEWNLFDMTADNRYGLSHMQVQSIAFFNPSYDEGMKAGKPSVSKRTDFAARLIALREVAGLSQRAVAREMGISQPSYANWETHNVSLKPEQLTKLAQVLNVTMDALLEDGNGSRSKHGGPTGKVRRVFEEVNRLPRTRQQRIVSVVEDMLAAHRLAANG